MFFFIVPADFVFSKSSFLKNSFRNTIRVSNSLDPDQARRFVGPDLDPNCLQRLSADDTSRQIVELSSGLSSAWRCHDTCTSFTNAIYWENITLNKLTST